MQSMITQLEMARSHGPKEFPVSSWFPLKGDIGPHLGPCVESLLGFDVVQRNFCRPLRLMIEIPHDLMYKRARHSGSIV